MKRFKLYENIYIADKRNNALYNLTMMYGSGNEPSIKKFRKLTNNMYCHKSFWRRIKELFK